MPAPILKDGDRLNKRFRVVGAKPIGQGQFAEVYRAMDERPGSGSGSGSGTGAGVRYVAVKIERKDQTSTRERRALLELQGCKGVVNAIDSGTTNGRDNPFIVMDLVGDNLADVRRDKLRHSGSGSGSGPGARHSLRTVGWIGAQMLDILRGMHAKGYIHRDVKPSNVTLGGVSASADPDDTRRLYLIDLGLAKVFETARPTAGADAKPVAFRGSTTYTSINVHAGEQHGPRDDLWSLLYMLAECHEGTLPWRSIKDRGRAHLHGPGSEREDDAESVKAEIHQSKLECVKHPERLCPTRGTPSALVEFSRSLERVRHGPDTPDYDGLR